MQPFVGPGYYILINAIHSKLPFCYSKLEWKTNASERTRRIWNGYAIACECKSESKFAYDFFFSIAGRPNAVSRPGTLVPKEFVFANIFRFSLFIIFCLVHGILFCECRFFFSFAAVLLLLVVLAVFFWRFPLISFFLFLLFLPQYSYTINEWREREAKKTKIVRRGQNDFYHMNDSEHHPECAHMLGPTLKWTDFAFFFSLYRCFWWWTFNQSRNSLVAKLKVRF